MGNELLRTGSGYVDITAYKALQNYQKGESDMEFNRGEIFEYSTSNYEKKEALIISADFRSGSRFISILVLKNEEKGVINVPIITSSGIKYADCGLVSFCSSERLGNFLRIATDAEMAQIDEGIAKCLGIEQKTVEKVVEVPVEKIVEVTPPPADSAPNFKHMKLLEELTTVKAEANVYKNLYEQLLTKMIGQAV